MLGVVLVEVDTVSEVTNAQIKDMIAWAKAGSASWAARCNYELIEALRELLVLRQRYGVEENARLCLGYACGCDGSDLVAEPHVAECPARDKDLALRPWLYDVESENSGAEPETKYSCPCCDNAGCEWCTSTVY